MKKNLTDKQKKRLEERAYKKMLKQLSKDTMSNKKFSKRLKKITKPNKATCTKLTADQILQPVTNEEFDRYVKDMGLMFETANKYAKKAEE